MGGTLCVRRSVLLMMILNIVVLVVQADDPPTLSLPPSSILTVPDHFPSPSQQDHTPDWHDRSLKLIRLCDKITSPKVLTKLGWGWGMFKGCVLLLHKLLCKFPSDISYDCVVNPVRFPSKAVAFETGKAKDYVESNFNNCNKN
ncbi:uncharacterized protein LOC133881504 [Alnus glutinosa]|uniref:uncharacterized protein LOC133881504 n=1 Tax=Alnus glutinosa TaxID=3517 RepID=UPI002D782147|nr:uncharacterized protein LOC133881504 [Alnus glutinosa]